MPLTFDKKCIKKAITYLESLNDHASYVVIYDLKRIDREISNPFSNIPKKGNMDAELRSKYSYISDFENLLKEYSFLIKDKTKFNHLAKEYWDDRLKIDYYAIIGYVLKTNSLINSMEDYIVNQKEKENV